MSILRPTSKIFLLLPLLLTLLFTASCGKGGGSANGTVSQAKSWTFLVYMDGDNNLSGDALDDFAQIKAATSSTHIKVVVQLALLGATTKRYLVANGMTTLLADMGVLNMADGQTITDFLSWAKNAYPADRTVLVLWDHGAGWDELTPAAPAAMLAPRKVGLSMFTEPGSNDVVLANHLIRQAIEKSGIKLDLLGIDGCSMSTIEALYEFRGLAGVLVASEELIPDAGWDYNALLSGLAASQGITAEEFGTLAVSTYRNFYEAHTPKDFTLVAFRSSGLDNIAVEINRVALKLLGLMNDPATRNATMAAITTARANAQVIDPNGTVYVYVDLVDLFNRLGVTTTLPALMSAATISEYHGSGRPNAHGVSIVFFKLPEAVTFNVYDPNYKNYDSVTNTGNQGEFINNFQWDELLNTYYTSAGLL
jgi:hypothetical protein